MPATRLHRKWSLIRTWTASVRSPADWPAAVLLAMFRTRPVDGAGVVSRAMRRIFPRIRIRPDLLGGHSVGIDPSRLAAFVIYEEIFIHGIYDLGRVAFEPDAIVDCGAFEGHFSLLARARFPAAPILAFEPDLDNFAGLAANTAHPALRIDARLAAVSIEDGEGLFAGSGCGGRLGDGPDARRVPIRNLRTVLAELKCERVVLKLDIEGEEARLLPALLPVLPRRCAIFFEWHQGRDEYAVVARLLAAHGFDLAVVREHRVDNRLYIDAFAQRT